MRRLAVHSTELSSNTGNCVILDDSEDDMLEMLCLLSRTRLYTTRGTTPTAHREMGAGCNRTSGRVGEKHKIE